MPTAINSGEFYDPSIWDTGIAPGPGDAVDLAGFSIALYSSALISVASLTDSVGGGGISSNQAAWSFSGTLNPQIAGYALLTVLGGQTLTLSNVTIQQNAAGATAIKTTVGAGSPILQFQGSCYVNSPSDGSNIFEFGTGTYTLIMGSGTPPSAADIRRNVTIDGVTGTCDVPSANDTRYNVAVDATTGLCHVPTAAETQQGISVDVSGVGTYLGSVPTASAVAAAVWRDLATSSDFVTVNSIGKKLANLSVPTTSAVAAAVWRDQTSSSDFASVGTIGKQLANLPSPPTPPTTSAIAAAVWRDQTSSADFTSVGTIGRQMANLPSPPTTSAIAASVWRDQTSSADFTSVGTIGKQLATSGGGGGGGATTVALSPMGGILQGDFTIVAKDAYMAADGRAIAFATQNGVDWPEDLTGWTITFTATKSQYNVSSGSSTITTTGTVAYATGQQAVYIELAESLTTGAAPGIGTQGYFFDVIATNGSDRATLAHGTMSVLAPISS